jgi:4-amino-4-deoxy-L-arabinose transferase-like glycosyltransferase
VLGGALAPLGYRLGDGSLYDWDEAIYAQAAKEMSRTGVSGHITWDGRPFFHKPPLYFWLTALTYHLTGVNEFGARLWSALFGFGSLALTLVLGARLRSWVVGVGAVLLLLVVDHAYYSQWWNFLSLSRVGMMDVPLTFWIMLAMLCVWEAERRPWLLALMGLPVGLAVLTKAWPGFLPIVLALSYRCLTHRGLKPDLKHWGLAAGLATAVILPWHLWQYGVHGHLFVQEYVGLNLVERLFRPVEEHRGGAWFYAAVIRQGFSVWAYAIPLACLWGTWKVVRRKDRGAALLLIWAVVPLLLFSLAQTKLGWYINMVYPPLALLIMLFVADYLREYVALGVVVAGMALCCWHLPSPADGSPEVKAFARQAGSVLAPGETVYVIRPTCAEEGPSLTAGALFVTNTNIRTTLVFYLDRPLLCIAEGQVLAGTRLRNAYAIADAEAWSRVSHLGEVVVQALDGGAGYLLMRLK